jgi:putative ABC transport system permease protein
MIAWLNQVAQITLINVRNIPRRAGTSLVVVVGIAGVVGVLVSVLAMSEGFRHTLASTGRENRVIMLRSGSDSELSSGLPRDQATLLASLPGIARDAGGHPLASAELMVMVDLPRRGESNPNNVPFRGVQPSAFAIREELRIAAGRPFARGVREVIAGKKAAQQFEGLSVGSTIAFRDSDWKVVGIFESGGDVHESEVWADGEVAMSAFRRQGYQSLTATLTGGSEADVAALRDAVSRDRRLSIAVLREPEYYAKQAKVLSNLIDVLGYTVAGFMAVGAMFGALNCMYSAIASRQVEIATLRATGFGGAPVVVSVMIEALLLALAGGAVGGAAAYLYCDGASLATLNFSTFSQVAFDLEVTPRLIVQGLVWSLLIGAAGGLPPAIRAARLPVTVALRAI